VQGRFESGALVSEELPQLRLRPSPKFAYRGAFDLPIKGVALATRHHFAEERDGTIARLIVVQFEHWTTADRAYSFDLPEPIVLAGTVYGRWAFELSVNAERADHPGLEMATSADHLEQLNLTLPDRHAVARFARIVGPERRHEVIVFFHECGPDASVEDIHERALTAFSLE
jgi:hypothetical protein